MLEVAMKKYLIFTVLLVIICGFVILDFNQHVKLSKNSDGHRLTAKSGSITLSSVPPNDDEYHVVRSLGMTSNAFIYSISSKDDSIQNMEFWIDQYTNGQKQTILQSKSEIKRDQVYKLTLGSIDVNENLEMWIASVRDGGNFNSMKTLVPKSKFVASVSQNLLENAEIVKDKIIDLGMVIRNKDSNSFELNGKVEEAIKVNSEVFLFQCRFF
jgi:hypothetical protein